MTDSILKTAGATAYANNTIIGEVAEGKLSQVRFDLNLGADANLKNEDGIPLIITAIRNEMAYNARDLVTALLEHGADINAKTPDGSSILCAAIDSSTDNSYGRVEFILSKGYQPQRADYLHAVSKNKIGIAKF